MRGLAAGRVLHRTGYDIANLNVGISIAFAVLAIVMLVVLRIGLYMVTMPAIPAT